MQALHDAILDALLNGGVLSEEMLERLLSDKAERMRSNRDELESLIQRIIERLSEQGFVSMAGQPGKHGVAGSRAARRTARRGSKSPTRRSTSSAIARCATCSAPPDAAAPAATTRANWPPASKPAARPRQYEFGDTMNLDASATVLNAVQESHDSGLIGVEPTRRADTAESSTSTSPTKT